MQPGYAAVRHYSGVLPSPDKQKGNGCCLFMAEGEGFALQRLPTGNAKGTIACSPDMPRCGIIRGFCPRRINKKATGVAFLWRKARDSPYSDCRQGMPRAQSRAARILSHQRFSSFILRLLPAVRYFYLTARIVGKSAF